MDNLPIKQFKKRFKNSAKQAINATADEVLSMLFDGNLPTGATWHPNGFVVFRLGTLADFAKAHPNIDSTWLTNENANNMLRLHVWPKERREYFPDHPRTHCHSFLLTSKILAGKYRDDMLVTSDSPRITNTPALLTGRTSFDPDPYDLLRVDYENPDLAQLVPSDEKIYVNGIAARKRAPGEFHHMDTQVFHTTQIDDDDFCMTLLVTSSDRFGNDRVINDIGSNGLWVPRVPVNEVDLMRIVKQAGQEMRAQIGIREIL